MTCGIIPSHAVYMHFNAQMRGKIMAGNFPNLMKTINPQTQEIQQIPSEINTCVHTHMNNKPRHIMNKLLNTGVKNNIPLTAVALWIGCHPAN